MLTIYLSVFIVLFLFGVIFVVPTKNTDEKNIVGNQVDLKVLTFACAIWPLAALLLIAFSVMNIFK